MAQIISGVVFAQAGEAVPAAAPTQHQAAKPQNQPARAGSPAPEKTNERPEDSSPVLLQDSVSKRENSPARLPTRGAKFVDDADSAHDKGKERPMRERKLAVGDTVAPRTKKKRKNVIPIRDEGF